MTDPWTTVAALESAIRYGGSGLADVPDLVIKVIDGELWREFKSPRGQEKHPSFEAFVKAPNPGGLGATVELLQDLCRRRKDVLDKIDSATQRKHGGDHKSEDYRIKIDNIQLDKAPSGTSESAALRRLRKDRPDLHARVLDGELSANAAAVEAGFRKRTITVRTDDPAKIAATLRRNLEPWTLYNVLKLLTEVET